MVLHIALLPYCPNAYDSTGTKRPASRDLNGGAVRLTHHLHGIERPHAADQLPQRNPLPSSDPTGQTSEQGKLRNRSPSKSSLHNVMQNRHPARRRNANQCFLTDDFTRRLTERIPRAVIWWSRTGSNRRPPACKAGALPAELRPLMNWWAWEDLNLRPHAYQARALTN